MARGPGSIILTDDWEKMPMARAVEGSEFDRSIKAWVVPQPTPRAAVAIMRLFPHLADEHPELVALRDTLLHDARPFDNATPFNQRIDAPNVRGVLLAEGKDFYDFQAIDLGYAAAVLRRHRAFEIAWERGLGKTLAACALIDNLAAQRTLVICPNTAKLPVWKAEVERFLPRHKAIVLPNGSPERREKLLQYVANLYDPFVFIVHYESLALIAKSRSNWGGWKRLGTWDLTVADESHRFSNASTQQHRGLRHVPTHMKVSMTGSMIMNHPEEIYGRLTWMFPKQYSSKWRDWNDRFLDYVEGERKILIGPNPDTLDQMRQELGVFTVYRRKADELDLPERTEQTLRVELQPAQRKAYNELRDNLITTLDDGSDILTLEPVVLLTRLRQVATGLELLSGEVTGSSKLDLAMDLVRDNPDDPFVIFSWYKTAAKAIAERLESKGIETFLVTGDTTHKQRAERIAAFQGGAGRVFVGTISTLGESVNLHRANQAVFLDRSWNPAQNEQAADRIYRIGQENAVTITYIVAKDTVDEYNVLPTINNKEQLRRAILGGV